MVASNLTAMGQSNCPPLNRCHSRFADGRAELLSPLEIRAQENTGQSNQAKHSTTLAATHALGSNQKLAFGWESASRIITSHHRAQIPLTQKKNQTTPRDDSTLHLTAAKHSTTTATGRNSDLYASAPCEPAHCAKRAPHRISRDFCMHLKSAITANAIGSHPSVSVCSSKDLSSYASGLAPLSLAVRKHQWCAQK